MAVPTGTASLGDIQAEFGGSNPIGLSEYYGAASGVPTSGEISINDFRGKSDFPTVTVQSAYYSTGKSGAYGYSEGTYGSISPTSVFGVTITAANTDDSASPVFSLWLQGSRAKSFFTAVTVQNYGRLTTASATHSAGTTTYWRWPVGSTWGTGSRTLTFEP